MAFWACFPLNHTFCYCLIWRLPLIFFFFPTILMKNPGPFPTQQKSDSFVFSINSLYLTRLIGWSVCVGQWQRGESRRVDRLWWWWRWLGWRQRGWQSHSLTHITLFSTLSVSLSLPESYLFIIIIFFFLILN